MTAWQTEAEIRQLRRWYLALLRRRAIAEASQSAAWTPGTLVEADREKVENLILSKARPVTKKKQLAPLLSWRATVTLAIIGFIFSFLACLRCFATSFDLGLTSSVVLGFVVECLLVAQLVSVYKTSRTIGVTLVQTLSGTTGSATDPNKSNEALITDVQMEIERLKESQILIADYPQEVVCTLDQELSFCAVSPSSRHVLGFHHTEITNMALAKLCSAAEFTRIQSAFERAMTEGGEVRAEFSMVADQGKPVDTAWTIEWSNTNSRYFSTVKNVTAEKELERMRQEFVAVLSHDLRSPIMNVQLTLQLIEEGLYGNLDDSGLSRIHNANRVIDFLLLLIADILDLHRSETVGVDLDLGEVDCEVLFSQSADAVKVMADAKNVALVIVKTPLRLRLDAVRMTRVLINLLTNAIKFSSADSTVSLSLDNCPTSIRFVVSDEGPGVSDNMLPQLFSRFSRAKGEHGGTGLGLYASRAIVEAHGGRLLHEPVDPHGSKFIVELPKTFE